MNKLRVLDGTALKIIAAVTMLIDHIGFIFFPGQMVYRAIGRIAMPCFAFCVAEGCIYTRDRRQYLLRLFLFALITEIPFDLAFYGRVIYPDYQNIMFTFFLAVLGITLYEWIPNVYAGSFLLAGCALLAFIFNCDYRFFAVFAVYIYYFLKKYDLWIRELAGTGFLILSRTKGMHAYVFLSLFPLLLYNGKKGPGLKWLFYLFYPGHLLVLYLLKRYM